MKKILKLTAVLFFPVVFASSAHPALAATVTQVITQSELGDKVMEISGDSFYAYQNTSLGEPVPEPPAPANWKRISFNDSSWLGAQDAYSTNPSVTEGAPHWWCWVDSPANPEYYRLLGYNVNCNPLGTNHASWPPPPTDPQQLVGPSGFVNRESILLRKTYTLNPPAGYIVDSVTLDLWSDNNSWAYIDNGSGPQLITTGGLGGITSGSTTPYEVYSYNVTSLSTGGSSIPGQSITNTLAIQVSNDNQGGSANPIGVAYKLVATYTSIPVTPPVLHPPSCPPPGSTATLSWDSSYGATYYALRVNNTADGWDGSCSSSAGDFCQNVNSTSYQFTSSPGATYGWWLHSCNDGGCSLQTNGAEFTCTPTLNAPAITSLQVNNADSGQTGGFTGVSKTSGLTQAENGANWLNPMSIRLNATGSDGQPNSTVKEYYVAFYDKADPKGLASITSTTDFLTDIQDRLNTDPKSGFLLKYDTTGPTWSVWEATSPTTAGWTQVMSTSNPIPIQDYSSPRQLILYVYRGVNNSPRSWQVKLMKAFGSKSLYTGASVVDNNTLTNTQAEIP